LRPGALAISTRVLIPHGLFCLQTGIEVIIDEVRLNGMSAEHQNEQHPFHLTFLLVRNPRSCRELNLTGAPSLGLGLLLIDHKAAIARQSRSTASAGSVGSIWSWPGSPRLFMQMSEEDLFARSKKQSGIWRATDERNESRSTDRGRVDKLAGIAMTLRFAAPKKALTQASALFHLIAASRDDDGSRKLSDVPHPYNSALSYSV